MKHIYAIIIILAISIAPLLAGVPSVRGENGRLSLSDSINTANGLSANDATFVYKDSRGYIWIATYNGLNRYNGHSVTSYKNNVDDMILPSNRVRVIEEDANGMLWIGTDLGLVVYDYTNDSFFVKKGFEIGGIIRDIKIIDNNIYAISETNGVAIYDMQFNYIGCDRMQDEKPVMSDCISYSGSLFIASSDGIIEYNTASRKFHNYLRGLDIHSIIASTSKQETIFLGTSTGLFEVVVKENSNMRDKEIRILDHKYSLIKIKSLVEDQNGDLWIGSAFDGLIFSGNNKASKLHLEKHLEKCRISSILMLDGGDVWVTTYNKGAFKFSPFVDVFKVPYEDKQLKMTWVYPLGKDRLILRSNQDIYVYNINTCCYESTPEPLQQLLNTIKVARFFVDPQQRVWFVSDSGCWCYDFNSSKSLFLGNDPILESKTSAPMAVAQDADGNIWAGYSDDLLKIYLNDDNSLKKIESILDNDYFSDKETHRVRTIYYDVQTNKTWVGTDQQGLFIIPANVSLAEAKIEHYHHNRADYYSLSSNFVSSIMRDRSGVMWIGTEQGGLCKVDENGGCLKFKHYAEDQGLSNNIVKSILYDSDDILWIATSVGLNSFDPIKEMFHSYKISDGLPFDEFLYSSIASSNGELFFTGTDGIMFFDPELLQRDEALPKLHFNGLKIFNNMIKPNVPYDGKVIINHSLQSGDTLTLKHNQNTFTIGIDAICEKNTSGQKFHYILEPDNRQWTSSHISEDKISFDGLQSGKYKLRVVASNSYGDMTQEKYLHIRIKRPIYGSIVAYIIYTLIVISIIVSVVYFMMHTQKLKHKLSLEEQEKDTIKRTNIEKQQYFANISHELKTPLTLIMAPLAILDDHFKLDINMKTNLKIMQRQVRKMLQLIDLAHGIQLSDENRLMLKKERFMMHDLVKDTFDDFQYLAKFDKKEFNVEHPNCTLSVEADRDMLEKVLNNLLNNAFKYTVAGDTIALSYQYQNEMLIIRVTDSGAGILPEDQARIFERYYTSKSIETKKVGGTGIGLAFCENLVKLHGGTLRVESEYGIGTTFIIELPIVVSEEELIKGASDKQDINQTALILGSAEMNSIEIDSSIKERLVYMVEDNGEMRTFISNIIGRYFNVQSFASASECLSAIESCIPDLIVSDVMMPEMNGDKMCEIIKSDLRTSHIPIILLTARYTVDDKIKGIELGADSYIGKPFYPKHLITRISALLKGRQRLYEQFQKGLPLVQNSQQAGGVSIRDAELINSLYQLFDKNLDNEDIELDSFAVELGINRTLFYSKVKSLTDMSPYELLKNYRLQRAKTLILSGNYNVNEVCIMTGFKNRTHFSRVFKQHFGVSPSKVTENEA